MLGIFADIGIYYIHTADCRQAIVGQSCASRNKLFEIGFKVSKMLRTSSSSQFCLIRGIFGDDQIGHMEPQS
ncbi:hypothetical protein AXW83_15430 [Bosea sp. PAMC 26642]|nr:hypothetical protein AXW83_15430 [Bosea sp. PAMC 26642]